MPTGLVKLVGQGMAHERRRRQLGPRWEWQPRGGHRVQSGTVHEKFLGGRFTRCRARAAPRQLAAAGQASRIYCICILHIWTLHVTRMMCFHVGFCARHQAAQNRLSYSLNLRLTGPSRGYRYFVARPEERPRPLTRLTEFPIVAPALSPSASSSAPTSPLPPWPLVSPRPPLNVTHTA